MTLEVCQPTKLANSVSSGFSKMESNRSDTCPKPLASTCTCAHTFFFPTSGAHTSTVRLRQIYRNVDKTEGKNGTDIYISNLSHQSNKILDGSNVRQEGLSQLAVSVSEVQQGEYRACQEEQAASHTSSGPEAEGNKCFYSPHFLSFIWSKTPAYGMVPHSGGSSHRVQTTPPAHAQRVVSSGLLEPAKITANQH